MSGCGCRFVRLSTLALLGLLLSEGGRTAQADDAVKQVRFPLQINENKRYLVDADKKPFLVVGDTAWSLIAQLTEKEAVEYLEDRKQRGFNSIIVNLIERKYADKAPANINGVKPFLKEGDLTQPDPKYFDQAARVIAAAGERGICVWLCPAYLGWGGGDEGWFEVIKAAGPKALQRYGELIGQRFKDFPNIVWMPGGDYALPPSERWAGHELALGIRAGGAKQLMTAHGGQTTAVETFGEQDWLAIDNVYSYDLDIWKRYQATYQNKTIRPFVLSEAAYEGEHQATPDRIRRQAWWAVLSGACGQFFGCNPIWYFDSKHGFVDRKAAPHWRKALNLAGSQDMTRLANILQRYPWYELIPDFKDELFSISSGDDVLKATAAVAKNRELAIIYIPSHGKQSRELVLNLSKWSGLVQARWHNPARDPTRDDNPLTLKNLKMQTISTPGDNGTGTSDWVLVLKASNQR